MMKSCTIDGPVGTQPDLQCLSIAILQEDNDFATTPMVAVRPDRPGRSEDEEDLYTSFEEAISARVARVSRQLTRLSSTTTPSAPAPVNASTPASRPPSRFARAAQHCWSARQRAVVLFCLGLSLLMVGFDLMGLLVLCR